MSRAPLPISERVSRLRDRKKRAGLKRVEVFIPADKLSLLKAYVAELRASSQSEAKERARKLIAKAYKQFYASYLDNIKVNPETADFADAAIVAAALIHRGNSEAYRLGQEINKLIR